MEKGKVNIKMCFMASLFCGFFFLPSSCHRSGEYPSGVEEALALAGENAPELERVLQYYSRDPGDSLKFRAACFLIGNMPAHFSYAAPAIDSFHCAMGRVFSLSGSGRGEVDEVRYATAYDSAWARWGAEILATATLIPDVQAVTARFLIDNIEEAFSVWRKPWNSRVSFDLFCRYVLPYRLGNEPLSDWRPLYRERKAAYLRPVAERANPTYLYGVCNALNRGFIDNLYEPSFPLPEFPLDRLVDLKSGTCREFALMAAAYGRAFGLPVAVDFAPQWGNRSLGHEWNVLLPGEDMPLPYGVNGILGTQSYDMRGDVVAKIYRRTYHRVPGNLYDAAAGAEAIPPLFQTPCVEDVTGSYADTSTLHVSLFTDSLPASRRYAYLAVFDNRAWQSVAWGSVRPDASVFFRGVGQSCVYLPAFYEADGSLRPAAWPVLCLPGGNRVLEPDARRKQSLRLTRKYRYSYVLDDCAGYLVGGFFQAANRPDFSDAVLLDSITARPASRFTRVDVSAAARGYYRYFRYVGARGMHCNISEIAVYDTDGQLLLPRKVFAADGGREGTLPSMAFDGDVLTCFMTERPDEGWVAADFGRPVRIGRFYYLPRNDDNFIRDGELYELFYWDASGWRSLGRQTGTMEGELVYENVPSNALFLLHNHTKGQEERIFTYEDGRQIWW